MSSPASKPCQAKAPKPSPALLALQQQGLELPGSRTTSISPESSLGREGAVGVSPLSITSTPSNMEGSATVASQRLQPIRPYSTDSVETTVTNILNLYINLSEQSLKSDYEGMTLDCDVSDEDNSPLHTVYQPKAYRDTVAPLLEHQFSGDKLTVPPMSSPQSVASMPTLVHPNASASVPLLNIAQDISADYHSQTAAVTSLSQSSIQITPEMSPQPKALQPGINDHLDHEKRKEIELEVPDVRDAGSWYDQLLSSISLGESEPKLRDSQLSAISPEGGINYQRQLAYDALCPPKPKCSPSLQPINHLSSISTSTARSIDNWSPKENSCRSESVSTTTMLDCSMPKLEMHDQQSAVVTDIQSRLISLPAPDHTYETSHPHSTSPQISEHARTLTIDPFAVKTVDGLTPSNLDHYQEANDSLGGQLKQAWKERFGRKKHKINSHKRSKTTSESALPSVHTVFEEEAESYKYRYWKSHVSEPARIDAHSGYPTIQPDLRNEDQAEEPDERRRSVNSGPGPAVSENKSPKAADHNIETKVASMPSRPGSANLHSLRKSSGTPVMYNNELFEASGGPKKRSRLAGRLMMSAEEKRRQKVKESIVVLGSEKINGGVSKSGRQSKENGKELVKI